MRNTAPGPSDGAHRRAPTRRSPAQQRPGIPTKTLWAAVALTFAGAASGADISQIYTAAVANDPVVARARATNAISKQGVVIARAAFLPQVSASAGRSKGSTSSDALDMNPQSPNFGRSAPETNYTSQSWGAGVSQTVINVPSWFGYRGAQARAKQADWDLENTHQALISRVAEAYLSVLTQQASLESAGAAEQAVRRQLEQVRQRFDVGLEAITGVLESKAAYDSAVVTRIQAESDHRVSFEALRTLTGVAYEEIDGIKADLPIVDPLPDDAEEWVRTAMATNHVIRSTQEALAAAELDLKNQIARQLPTLQASASYGSNSGQQSIGGFVVPDRGTSTSMSYSLSLSMPLFQGLRIHSGIKQSRLSLEVARQTLIQQELMVAEDIRTLFRSVVTDVLRVAARDEAIKSAEAALEATQTGYEVGTRNIVEVLNAQRQLFLNQYNYHQSRYDYVLNMLRLKESAGTLGEADIAELNGHMDPANPVRKAQ